MNDFEKLVEKVKTYNIEHPIFIGDKPLGAYFIFDQVTDEDVSQAEKSLGFELCKDYKDYLFTFGHLSCSGGHLNGIVHDEDDKPVFYLVSETEEARRIIQTPFPSNKLTLFSSEDSEEWFSFIDHDSGLMVNYDPFAKSFYSTDITIYEEVERAVGSRIND